MLKILIDELAKIADGKCYRKATFKNGKVRFSQPYPTKRAKKQLEKYRKETNG